MVFEHSDNLRDSTPHASPGNGEADQAGSCFSPLKSPLTIPELVDHLAEKGLVFSEDERSLIEDALGRYGYYRMRGYWLTLENEGRFRDAVRFADIVEIMDFDQELSLFLLEMITPVELQLRAQIVDVLGCAYGADALGKRELFKELDGFEGLQYTLEREQRQALSVQSPMVQHNLSRYGRLPIWAQAEISSLGTLSKLFGNLSEKSSQAGIAAAFSISFPILKSWLRYLTQIRNMAAHHDRLYNRLFKIRPRLFKEHAHVDNARLFPAFIVLLRLADAADPARAQRHRTELARIIAEHPGVDLVPVGFPPDWREVLAIPSSAPRPRGKKGGRPAKASDEIAEALRLYNSRELPISEIVQRCGLSTSTLYKYIHLQEEGRP